MRLAIVLLALPCAATAQTPPGIAAERADYARWLETSPVSPYAAIYHQPFDRELIFGAGGEPTLAALPRATLRQDLFRLSLEAADGTRTVPRNRDVPLGAWRIRVNGDRSHGSVTVFGPLPRVAVPGWYDYVPAFVAQGTLEPPSRAETRRMLGLDGIEIEAELAGSFGARVAGETVRLAVYRMPEPGTEESELMVFFRDGSNGRGTYPAGRFLALQPLGGNRYRADFNRARNPFCGYNGIFPCPLPWPGNAITQALEVGERYGK